MEPVNKPKPTTIERWADIEELVRMSIGTNKGTWLADSNFGSDLWLLRQSGKLDGETVSTMERMLRECLQWLIADRLASAIAVTAERCGKSRIDYRVTVTRPGGGQATIEGVWGVV